MDNYIVDLVAFLYSQLVVRENSLIEIINDDLIVKLIVKHERSRYWNYNEGVEVRRISD